MHTIAVINSTFAYIYIHKIYFRPIVYIGCVILINLKTYKLTFTIY